MTLNRSTGFTLFFMVYNAEAVLPTDLDYGAPRVLAYDEAKVRKDRQDALDQLDEARKTTLLLVYLMHIDKSTSTQILL